MLVLALLCTGLTLLVLSSTPVLSQPSYIPLTNDVPVTVSVAANSTLYFTFSSSSPVSYQQTALLSVAASTGFPSIYASLTEPAPSPSSFTWSASYLTGGVVTILTQPPWLAYVAVVASPLSSSNFTLVAAAYDPAAAQSSVIPLRDAQPQASALAAGEYRYYSYSLSSNTSALSIAETGPYGWPVILVNGPNSSALPTVGASQWSSATGSLQLVNIVNATMGAYSIGLWSNTSAVFSLLAAAATSLQPLQLGVVYPGVVVARELRFYFLYIDALLIPSSGALTVSLHSWSGDADLYCSNLTATPSNQGARWSSVQATPDDAISIDSSLLWPGNLYCAVLGYGISSTYTLSTSYGGFTLIAAGQPTVTEALSTGQTLSYFAYVFEGNSSSSLISVSVVSVTGPGTALWMMPYGRVPSPGYGLWFNFMLPLQGVQVPVSAVCGTAFAFAIPGSSPLLCQLNIVVVTQQPSVFQLTVTGAQSTVPLTAGQLMEGAANAEQAASFSFTVPDNLSNLTLAVFVTNQATDVTLSVGPLSSGNALTRVIWTVTQQPGEQLLVFQLDWTDPLLSSTNRPQGRYGVQVSTQQNATFTLQFTLVNASGYGGTISPLIDGQPQLGQLQPSDYAFFFFNSLPQQGWPYSVTFSVTWITGFGSMLVAVGSGTQPGPLLGQQSVYSGQLVTVDPNSLPVCTPNGSVNTTGPPCGYAVSLITNAAVSGPSQFSLTATTGKWARLIYTGSPARSQYGQVSASDFDLWAVSNLNTAFIGNSTLMVILTLTTGTVTLYASNVTTAPPNASSSQYSLQVQSMDALLIPLPGGLTQAVYYVSVLCTSTVTCQYSISVTNFYTNLLSTRLYNGGPVSAAIPAGQIAWYYLDLRTATSVAYLTVELEPALGSPSMYAACGSGATGSCPAERDAVYLVRSRPWTAAARADRPAGQRQCKLPAAAGGSSRVERLERRVRPVDGHSGSADGDRHGDDGGAGDGRLPGQLLPVPAVRQRPDGRPVLRADYPARVLPAAAAAAAQPQRGVPERVHPRCDVHVAGQRGAAEHGRRPQPGGDQLHAACGRPARRVLLPGFSEQLAHSVPVHAAEHQQPAAAARAGQQRAADRIQLRHRLLLVQQPAGQHRSLLRPGCPGAVRHAAARHAAAVPGRQLVAAARRQLDLRHDAQHRPVTRSASASVPAGQHVPDCELHPRVHGHYQPQRSELLRHRGHVTALHSADRRTAAGRAERQHGVPGLSVRAASRLAGCDCHRDVRDSGGPGLLVPVRPA